MAFRRVPSLSGVRKAAARQFSALEVHNFRMLFLGQVISLIGTWMQSVGLSWLALELTGSPVAIGLVTTAQFLPMMLFGLFGGVLADRLPRRKTLVIVQAAALVHAAFLGAIVLTGVVELWHVYVMAAVAGLLSAVERPTRQSFLAELVGRDRLPNAVGLHSSILNGSRVVGPAVAGVLIALVGVEWTFLLNAASYIAVLVGYARMRPAEFFPVRSRPGGGAFTQVLEGLRFAIRTPGPAYIFIIIGFTGTFGFNFTVVVPILARFALHAGPAKFGLLTSALSLGSFIAAIWVAGGGARSHRFITVWALAFSGFFALLAVSGTYWLTAAILFFVGFSSIAMMTSANTTLQLDAPEHMRGRVISIYMLLMTGSTPVGGFLTGLLSSWTNIRLTLAIEGLLCALGVVVALYYRARHREAFRIPPVRADATAAGGS